MLEYVQQEFVTAQAEELIERARVCVRCGRRLATKDVERRRVHTLFGRISLSATRLLSGGCGGSRRAAFSPLRGWLTRRTNELQYQAARWGSEHSYREAAPILQELLPVDWRFGHVRVRDAAWRPAPGWSRRPICPRFRNTSRSELRSRPQRRPSTAATSDVLGKDRAGISRS